MAADGTATGRVFLRPPGDIDVTEGHDEGACRLPRGSAVDTQVVVIVDESGTAAVRLAKPADTPRTVVTARR
jgi:hypothetical protein